ncbi:MAG: glycosyltransferase family 4 protein [Acidimicrobiales bacterium]
MRDVLLLAEQLRRPVPGGIATYVRGLVQGLDSMAVAGEAVPSRVVLYGGRAPRDDELATSDRPVVSAALPTRLLTKAWDLGLFDVPREFELVHATSPATPPARHAALAVTVHDTAWRVVPGAFPPRGRRWHEAALRRALRRAEAVVVPVPALADQLRRGGATPRQLTVIPHGCDHLPPADDAGATGLLAEHGVRGDFVLAVGTREPRKNLDRLVAAHRRAAERLGPGNALVVVGPAGWGTGAGPGMMVLGAVSPAVLAALYRRARLLAYVPIVEGYGLPPLEAMQAGTPVVASAVPSIDGDLGRRAALVVDPSDVDAIADALVRVSRDESLRAGLVAAGHELAVSRTWAAAARAHVELWKAMT